MINVDENDFHELMIGFVRYCLPRHSYIVGDCIYIVKKHWADLPEGTKAVIKRDVGEHIHDTQERISDYDNDFRTFIKIDLDSWIALFQWMNAN